MSSGNDSIECNSCAHISRKDQYERRCSPLAWRHPIKVFDREWSFHNGTPKWMSGHGSPYVISCCMSISIVDTLTFSYALASLGMRFQRGESYPDTGIVDRIHGNEQIV